MKHFFIFAIFDVQIYFLTEYDVSFSHHFMTGWCEHEVEDIHFDSYQLVPFHSVSLLGNNLRILWQGFSGMLANVDFSASHRSIELTGSRSLLQMFNLIPQMLNWIEILWLSSLVR